MKFEAVDRSDDDFGFVSPPCNINVFFHLSVVSCVCSRRGTLACSCSFNPRARRCFVNNCLCLSVAGSACKHIPMVLGHITVVVIWSKYSSRDHIKSYLLNLAERRFTSPFHCWRTSFLQLQSVLCALDQHISPHYENSQVSLWLKFSSLQTLRRKKKWWWTLLIFTPMYGTCAAECCTTALSWNVTSWSRSVSELKFIKHRDSLQRCLRQGCRFLIAEPTVW